MPANKFTYFDLRGLGETSRWLFKIAKVDFEDNRLSFKFGTPGDFSTLIAPEFTAMKEAGELDASMNKVPMLEVDGKKIGQSKAIERFLAREFGFMGADSVEAAQIEQLCETVIDFKNAFQKVRGVQDTTEKEAAMKKWFEEDLPVNVALAEKSVPPGPGPFLVGSKVSLADLVWYSFLAAPKGYFYDDNAEGAKASMDKCPRIKASTRAVAQIPELQEWLKTHPETPIRFVRA